MEPAEILKKPYARQIVPQPDGLFKAEIFEFPGCFAVGDTPAAALATLEEVAVDWIAATLAQGQNVPDPTESVGYSGKLVLRMPKSLHKKAAQFALRDGASLNQFIVSCLSERVGVLARPMIYAQPLQAVANVSLQIFAGNYPTLSCGGSVQNSTTGSGQSLLRLPVCPSRDEYHA